MMTGVILYGAPASGKDTITAALSTLDARFRLFRRAKCGPGRTTGYRMISASELDELRRGGEVIWANSRYGATYVVDRPQLLADAERARPVLHLGQVAAVRAVRTAVLPMRWLTVELWCPRPVAAQRIHARDTGDDAARLAAYDATERLTDADMVIDTSRVLPELAAAAMRLVQAGAELPHSIS
jgi:guanylate kinase